MVFTITVNKNVFFTFIWSLKTMKLNKNRYQVVNAINIAKILT